LGAVKEKLEAEWELVKFMGQVRNKIDMIPMAIARHQFDQKIRLGRKC